MSDKDKGSRKTTKDGGKDPQKTTGATNPGHPREKSKPATKKNDPTAEGPPIPGRGGGNG